ncbi:MAG: glycoside hydrolase family 2 TIM barrel-domain containing protein [Flavitalea sp.]
MKIKVASLLLFYFLSATVQASAQSGDTAVPSKVFFRPLPSNSQVIMLDGTWRINPKPGNDFQTAAITENHWSDFTVPGQWTQQGFDIPDSVQAAVARDFTVPASWAGKTIKLRFDAVHGGTHYWLNGKYLGYNEALFIPVEFDVTDIIRPGASNHLALGITVKTISEDLSNSSDYVAHNLGGIDRSVRLFALPANHMAGLNYQTRLDSNYQHATLWLDMGIVNKGKKGTVRVSLSDPGGKKIKLSGNEFIIDSRGPQATTVQKQFFISDPMKWSAEKPHLYKLVAELINDGKVEDRIEQAIGFRQVEVHGSELLVNGKSVKITGICRHEIDALTGRAATVKYAREDALLFKKANFNMVRTSHYPHTREFLEECDRIGLYVESEGPFCWARKQGDDPSITQHFLNPTAAMINYNRNHPSIILWSIANESGKWADSASRLQVNFVKTLELYKRMDNTRPVIFNSEWNKDGGLCDIACLHYPPYPLDGLKYIKGETRPILLDEYMPTQTWHLEELRLNPGLDLMWSMGANSDTSWWNQLYYSPNFLGGTIWAGIDEEFYFKDGRNSGFGPYKGDGPWGFVDVWRRPKSTLWDAQLMFSPIRVPIRTVAYTPGVKTVTIPVENRYNFTNLKEIFISWEIAGRKGISRISAEPKTTGKIIVPVPEGTQAGALLALRFLNKQKELISAHGIRLGKRKPAIIAQANGGRPEWKDDGRLITIKGKDFAFVIDRTSGKITPAGKRKFPLLEFPSFFCARREVRNLFIPDGLRYAEFPEKDKTRIDSALVEEYPQALSIVFKRHDELFQGEVGLLIDKNGQCTLSYDYINKAAEYIPGETGLQFFMDSSCKEISWDRQTEWEIYPDDHIGRATGKAAAYAKENSANAYPPYLSKPSWGWRHDANEFGTIDFRTSKYRIYEAKLLSPGGAGIEVVSDGTTDVRARLTNGGVLFHATRSITYPKLYFDRIHPPRLAVDEQPLKKGERLTGSFSVSFISE